VREREREWLNMGGIQQEVGLHWEEEPETNDITLLINIHEQREHGLTA